MFHAFPDYRKCGEATGDEFDSQKGQSKTVPGEALLADLLPACLGFSKTYN